MQLAKFVVYVDAEKSNVLQEYVGCRTKSFNYIFFFAGPCGLTPLLRAVRAGDETVVALLHRFS